MRKLRYLILTVLMVVLLTTLTATAPAAPKGGNDFVLTLLHNNDGESQLINAGSGLEDFGGVARFATVAENLKWDALHGPREGKDLRGAKRGVLMVSSGDNFLAGPEFNVSLEKGVPFYDTIAMDLIGYDAVTIGNHDFDFGPDVLADFIIGYELTQPPYLSANLDFSGEPRLQELVEEGRIAESVVVQERGENIGIIGATTPALPFISSPRNVEVIEDVAGEIMEEVNELQAMGVDKIILISHLQSIQEDLALAPMLDGIDIMVAGGGDELLANEDDLLIPGDEAVVFGEYPLVATDSDGTEIPVVTTSGAYQYVGRLTVEFDGQGNLVDWFDELSGPVRVAGGDNPDAVEPDPVVQERVVEPVIAALADLASNVIATSEVPLNGVREDVRTQETNEGDLIADSLFWQAEQLAASFGVPEPDVALQNGGGIRNDSVIPAGPLTELDTFSMVPFPNFVVLVPDIPREQFKAILENAVSRVEFVDGRFAQISGFSFTYDISAPAGSRVQDVVLDGGTVIVSGGVVQPGDPIDIATIDFLANGGDQYPFNDAPFTRLGVTYQQALANYLTDGLGGTVTAADYPVGGEGRITQLP